MDSSHTAARLLTSIATILLRAGFDVPSAERLLRKAFVMASKETARALGSRATQSRIASIAGMSRLEVRTILADRGRRLPERQSTRIDQVVAAWRSDSRFTDGRGRPKNLELKGPHGSFEHLVKKYGRDVTSKTLRDELLFRGIAVLSKRKICLVGESYRLRSDSVAVESDLRFLVSQLEEIDFRRGRRSYVNKSISVEAPDKKAIQMLKRVSVGRIATVLHSLSEVSARVPTRALKSRNLARRLIVKATVASETED